MRDGEAENGAYDYGRTRSGGVFALAGLAAGGALLLIWGAWSTLATATEQERIAQPPDLKHVVEAISDKSIKMGKRVAREGRAAAKPET